MPCMCTIHCIPKMALENGNISANDDPSYGRWAYIPSPDRGNVGLDIFWSFSASSDSFLFGIYDGGSE